MCLKKTISVITLLAILAGPFLLMPRARAAGGDISPAIAVIRSGITLYKCGVCRETVNFSRDDFENVLGVGLKYITVTQLPGEEEGVVRLSGVPVVNGQTVAASSLSYLTFTPAFEEEGEGRFKFRCDAEGYAENEVPCVVVLTQNRNTSPLLSPGAFSTVRNVKTEYRLSCLEPDGDTVKYLVDSYPVSGAIQIENDAVIYTPKTNFTGKDSLVVRAVDRYGNSSPAANITINVGKSEIVFSDMSASSAHAAAIALAENSIVTYTYKDGEYLYSPALQVTRIDFLVMLMSSANIHVSDTYAALAFTDVGALSEGRKKYLAQAAAAGIVQSGSFAFRPGDYVTRREAAVWTAKMLDLKGRSSTFLDTGELDVETSLSITAVADAGIITAKNGYFFPEMTINREEAARILVKVMGT